MKNKKFITVASILILVLMSIVLITVIISGCNDAATISSYTACGCGCGGNEIGETEYYSKSRGEHNRYEQAIQADKEFINQCDPTAGCVNVACVKLVLTE